MVRGGGSAVDSRGGSVAGASQPAMALGSRRMPSKSIKPTHDGSSLKRVIEISAGNEAHHASPCSAPKYGDGGPVHGCDAVDLVDGDRPT